MEVLGNALLVASVAGVFAWWIDLPLTNTLANFIVSILLILLFTGLVVYGLGLTGNEREFLRSVVRNRLRLLRK